MFVRSATHRSVRPRRLGTATVEFAVIAPVLVAMVLGTVEVTRVLQAKQYMTDAARYGARVASRPGAANSAIQAAVTDVLDNYGIPANAVTTQVKVNGVVAEASSAASGTSITVSVSVPCSKIAWLTPLFFPATAVQTEPLTMVRH